jgi:hypothetical protein
VGIVTAGLGCWGRRVHATRLPHFSNAADLKYLRPLYLAAHTQTETPIPFVVGTKPSTYGALGFMASYRFVSYSIPPKFIPKPTFGSTHHKA